MKNILEFILITIILFFFWNILKRLFFSVFYKPTQQVPPKRPADFQQTKQKPLDQNPHGLNWDAEDAVYEEIKEEKKF